MRCWGRTVNYEIANRLTEVKTGTGGYSDAYLYLPNGSGGNTSLLDRIERGGGLLRDYSFDSGGFLDSVTAGANTVEFTFDAAGQLSLTERPAGNEKLLYFYDGRNYLAEAKEPPVPPCPSGTSPIFCDAFETSNLACWSGVSGGSSGGSCPWQEGGDRLAATYDSEGVLYGITRYPQGQPEEKLAILRFGNRPVAIWRKIGSSPATLTYLTTDHLGSPILAMNSTGTAVWSGGFEPFGRDFTVPSAESFGMFLRLPGQWEDPFFDPSTLGVNLHYNLHRWYEPGTGRYISGDPIPIIETQQFYVYASNRPLVFIDLYGLYEIVPGEPTPSPELDKLLVCIENCLGKSFVVTSTTKRRESGQHPAGKAADIRYKGPGTTPFTAEEFLCCGGKCGAGFGLDEYLHPSKNATGPHIHIQIPRGKLGGRGDIPPDCVPTPTCDEKKEKQEEGHHDKRRE